MWARLMLDPKEPTEETETRKETRSSATEHSIPGKEPPERKIREEPDPLKIQGQRDWLSSLHTRE